MQLGQAKSSRNLGFLLARYYLNDVLSGVKRACAFLGTGMRALEFEKSVASVEDVIEKANETAQTSLAFEA